MYAIVKTGGKQYNVKAGDVLDVEKLEGNEGDVVQLQTLLVRDGKATITDPEKLASIKVCATIVEQHKGDKVLVFKFKKRKGYKRTRGHRQQLTKICITELNGEKASVFKKGDKAVKKSAKATDAADKKAADKSGAKASTKAAAKTATKAADVKKDAVKADAKAAKAADDKKVEAKASAAKEASDKSAGSKSDNADLSKMTVAELKDLAKERGVKLQAGARKADIIEAIEKA